MKIVSALLIALCFSLAAGQCAAQSAEWKIAIPSKEEPGEPLVVSGVVYGPDGVTPLEGASVYVYHTDIKGYYSAGTTDNSNPRLKGTMRTDARGRYEFRTIKPGPYPAARVPAHIHFVVSAPGYRERVFEIVFEGDAFISDRMRADARQEESAFSIRPAERDREGVLRCVQHIKLRKA